MAFESANTGVSYLLRGLVQQTFHIIIPFVLDPAIIGGDVLIGLVTALIFGLMPIVQAANIRPLNVIRELPGGHRSGSTALTIALLLLVSALFCLLSVVVLNNVILGIGAVYGTFIFLGLLSLFSRWWCCWSASCPFPNVSACPTWVCSCWEPRCS